MDPFQENCDIEKLQEIVKDQQREIQYLNSVIRKLRDEPAPESQGDDKSMATLYHIKDGDDIVYVGIDSSQNQTRIGNHKLRSNGIRHHFHMIDVALACNPQYEFKTVKAGPKSEMAELERKHIEQYNPRYNQAMKPPTKETTCQKCQREFKYENSYKKHILTCAGPIESKKKKKSINSE